MFLLFVASLTVFVGLSYINNTSIEAATSRPSSVVIKTKGWGMNGVNVFMNKKKARNYANKLETTSSVATQSGSYLLSFVIGKASATAGGVWSLATYLDRIATKSTAKQIKKLTKNNNGVYLSSIKANSSQPGGEHVGAWNGTLSSAKSISKQGDFSIVKIIY